MKTLVGYASAFFCLVSSTCLAQVDIYQSDAYSVEEMCARQAEQDTTQDYAESYDTCIEQNHDNPMYQGGGEVEDQNDVETEEEIESN